jgi:YbbR domain-containing protein
MLHRNLPLKAASILLAIFLWFWVMLNEENPLTQRTVEVPVVTQGVQAGLALELGSRTVKVTLRGLEQDMADLKNEVHAVVPCVGLAAGSYRLAVRVQPPEDLAVVGVRPMNVQVMLEKIVSQSKPVEVKLVGEPIGGFDVKSADFSPKQVQVSGAGSRVDRTTHVVVTADLARMVPGVPVPVTAHALDGSGVPVEGVDITPPRVNVTAIAERVVVTETLPVVPRTQGALPRGLRLVSVQVDPPIVTLVLPAARAGEMTHIDTEALNLSSVRGNVSRAIRLVVPQGASLAEDERVTVTLRVEPIPQPVAPPQQPGEEPQG